MNVSPEKMKPKNASKVVVNASNGFIGGGGGGGPMQYSYIKSASSFYDTPGTQN